MSPSGSRMDLVYIVLLGATSGLSLGRYLDLVGTLLGVFTVAALFGMAGFLQRERIARLRAEVMR